MYDKQLIIDRINYVLENTEMSQDLVISLAKALQVPISYLVSRPLTKNELDDNLISAMEKLSSNDHDQILKFADLLKGIQDEMPSNR